MNTNINKFQNFEYYDTDLSCLNVKLKHGLGWLNKIHSIRKYSVHSPVNVIRK
jgi:hypothetical protein